MGNGNPSRLLDRQGLDEAFKALSAKLEKSGLHADIYIVGGAAMAMAFDARRATRDVDALFVPHGKVLEAAQEVAREMRLPRSWLNDQASVYMPADRSGAQLVFSSKSLTVQAANPEQLLAMKILSSRERDREDITFLIAHLDLHTPDSALAVATKVFPQETVPVRAVKMLQEILEGD